MTYRVIEADCIEAMRAMDKASVDAIVTDPPYGLEFMGKAWDGADGFRRSLNPNDVGRDNAFGRASARGPEYRAGRAFQEFSEVWAVEALRVLKPGGHLLAFGGTRTSHRMVCAIEDAGFEIRDSLLWLYGSGFPKSHNIGNGLGTALKPAHEPIVLARKPLAGTVQHNWQEHGTGPLNIDACRIGGPHIRSDAGTGLGIDDKDGKLYGHGIGGVVSPGHEAGRWPANVLLDEEAAAMLDEQTGELHGAGHAREAIREADAPGMFGMAGGDGHRFGDVGGASRFFYVAKASAVEREVGLAKLPVSGRTDDGYGSIQTPIVDRATPCENWEPKGRRNVHPTVKPIDLMRWLCRLVTPPGGTVLDPFTGSGTTGCAAVLEDFNFIGIEREAEYVVIANARIAHWWKQPVQLEMEAA